MFERVKNIFNLPAAILVILIFFIIIVYQKLIKNGRHSFMLYHLDDDQQTQEKMVDILEKTQPYEYAFSTIFWIIIIKHFVIKQ
jgi:hypothetical protein